MRNEASLSLVRTASRPTEGVLAIDIGGTKIDIAVADRDGLVIERRRIPTHAAAGPEQALARAAGTAIDLASAARVDLLAQAAVCPGVVRVDRVLLAPNLPGWENVALATALAEQLGVASLSVGNDVQAAALAELRSGALRDVDPGLYVNLGTGLGAALTVGGQVIAGAHGAAGEIGYTSLGGQLPTRGRAPLEELVGGKAITARRPELTTIPDDHPERSALAALGAAIANLAVALDPERIVLGGGLAASWPALLPSLRHWLHQAVPFPPEIEPAHFTTDASLHGAVALALESLTAPGSTSTHSFTRGASSCS